MATGTYEAIKAAKKMQEHQRRITGKEKESTRTTASKTAGKHAARAQQENIRKTAGPIHEIKWKATGKQQEGSNRKPKGTQKESNKKAVMAGQESSGKQQESAKEATESSRETRKRIVKTHETTAKQPESSKATQGCSSTATEIAQQNTKSTKDNIRRVAGTIRKSTETYKNQGSNKKTNYKINEQHCTKNAVTKKTIWKET